MREEIKITAKMWADQILHGKHDTGEFGTTAMSSMLRAMAPRPSENQLEIFQNVLCENLNIRLQKDSEILLGVDYEPDEELLDACRQSGISTSLLPVKSFTKTSFRKVQYKFGYGAKILCIDKL